MWRAFKLSHVEPHDHAFNRQVPAFMDVVLLERLLQVPVDAADRSLRGAFGAECAR